MFNATHLQNVLDMDLQTHTVKIIFVLIVILLIVLYVVNQMTVLHFKIIVIPTINVNSV